MKKLILCFVLLPFFAVSQESYTTLNGQKWDVNFDNAMRLAKKEHKNILLYFTGSDWCGPCKILKKDLFDTQEFADAATTFVLVYIDIPRSVDILTEKQLAQNKNLLRTHNKKGVFPLLKVLNAKGKTIDELSGYSMNGEVQYHLNLLTKHSK